MYEEDREFDRVTEQPRHRSRSPTIMEELLERRCYVRSYHGRVEHVHALKFGTANISLFLLFMVENI